MSTSATSAAGAGTGINDLMATMNAKPATTADDVDAQTDKFLTLLVTQMKNQDPLNPMDNAQVTSQMAQLSTVTGITKLNTTLASLQSNYQSSEAMQATSLIGRGVLVDGNLAALSSGKSVFGVQLASDADNVQVIITDPKTGKDVQAIDLGAQKAGTLPLAWDGVPDPNNLGSDGKPVTLADGVYKIRVVATQGGKQLDDAKTLSYDSVASVTTNATDGVKLYLPGKGASIALADIKQVL